MPKRVFMQRKQTCEFEIETCKQTSFFSFKKICRVHLSALEVVAQIGVDGEPFHLGLGQHRPDVDHLGEGQVQRPQGVCPVLLRAR